MDSSVVVLVIFLVVLLRCGRTDSSSPNNVDKESKANKKLILDKHHQVSADLTDWTVKLRKSPS
jgi:hypothetical protein